MKKRIRLIVNIVLFSCVSIAWLFMVFSGGGSLSSRGVKSLRYFTVLSNLFEAAACLVWTVVYFLKNNKKFSIIAEKLKYIAATSVMLTFSVVVLFLGFVYGFSDMFSGANLWFHLLVPLASAAEIIGLSDKKYTLKDNFISLIPVIAYGIGYLMNIIINGMGTGANTNDWYMFLAWGYPAGIIILIAILALTFALGLLLRIISNKINIRNEGVS